MIALVVAMLACSPQTIDAAAKADLAGLPVKACLWRGPTGDFVCARKTGCNRCDIEDTPCPPLDRRKAPDRG